MQEFVLGSAVKLTAILEDEISSGTTVTATIYDSRDIIAVEDADATEVTTKVFQYIYQSTDNNIAGTYRVIFKVTTGDYVSMAYDTFNFIDVLSD